MQQIINFLIRYRNLLLYVFLMVIALVFTIQSHNYHRHSFIHSTGSVTGGVMSVRNNVYGYFNLKSENEQLRNENALLRMKYLTTGDTLLGDEYSQLLSNRLPYKVFPARVVKNDYSKRDNFITIDIGKEQGIQSDMGVISTTGILGVVDVVGNSYSRVVSVLNSNISLNAQIKGTSTIGSLTWDGKDPYVMSLIDVPRLARVKKGDTIITGHQSVTFPPDILIGTVKNAQLVDNGSLYKIEVSLFNDMTDIGTAYVIKNRDKELIQSIDTLTVSNNE